jgi:serine/threonine protein kinase/Tfp pilus assembly protein PilF
MLGQTLGHYRLLEKIGEGGMGVVYRAHDERLDRDVALKVLPAGMLADDKARRRLRAEALALARLNHQNIEAIYDFDTQGDVDFLVVEYVAGPTLADRLAGGPMEEAEILRVGVQMAAALEEAHALDVAHRDLKPANIKVTAKGRVKVLDFGLATLLRPAGEAEATRSATEAGVTAGTVPYMAPEQLMGSVADARSDIFAAGVVLYEMATGRRPFQGRATAEVTDAILHSAPPPPTRIHADLSRRLEDLILKCLEKDPDNRYQSAKELAVDLRRLAAPSTPSDEVLLAVQQGRPRKAARTIAVAGGAVLAVMALLIALNAGGWRDRLLRGSDSGAPRSVAVLPFENLSGDPENAYFSNGIAAEILSHLVSIPGLKVVSVKGIKEQAADVKQIGRDVGVTAVLEGDVRRAGNRVRVTARLTNTETGTLIWASEPVDRELSDIFSVQGDIALQIAGALNAVLTPRLKESVERRPTQNLEAYDAYLRGKDALTRSQEERDIRAAMVNFERAIAADPGFALAHAMLSRTHAQMWWYYFDRTPQQIVLAKASIDRAVALQPDSPEVHAALGYYYYWCHLDYERALAEFATARKARPSDSDIFEGMGYIFRRQGRLREAIAALEGAMELDPRDATLALNLGESYALVRNLQQAGRWLDKANALTPEWVRPYGLKARFLLRVGGDITGARSTLAFASRLTIAEYRDVPYAGILLALFSRDYQAGLDQLSSQSFEAFDSQFWFVPKALLQAQLCGLLGQRESELKYYDAAARLLESKLRNAPDDARFHGSLGIAYAGLGRKTDAISHGKQALTLLPVSKEAYRGAFHLEEMARIYAMVGERDASIEQLEHLMSIPFDLAAPGLRLDPAWDSLRDHPRFQKLAGRSGN